MVESGPNPPVLCRAAAWNNDINATLCELGLAQFDCVDNHNEYRQPLFHCVDFSTIEIVRIDLMEVDKVRAWLFHWITGLFDLETLRVVLESETGIRV